MKKLAITLISILSLTAGLFSKTMRVSSYCPCELCCGKFADGITASGHKIKAGDKFVAAPKEYDFGTMLDIPNYGEVPVKDRGGAIEGNKIDVFFNDHNDALEWGVKYLKVEELQ